MSNVHVHVTMGTRVFRKYKTETEVKGSLQAKGIVTES